MIPNATLVSLTPPPEPDGRGGETTSAAIAYPADTRANVQVERRGTQISSGNVIIDAVVHCTVPLDVDPRRYVGGELTFRFDDVDYESTGRIVRIWGLFNTANRRVALSYEIEGVEC